MEYKVSVLVSCLAVSTAFAQNQLSDVEKCQGFTSLFDGTIATFRNQFVNYIKGQDNNTNLDAAWGLDAGTQSVTNSGADIRSKTKYRDFDLRMSYKNTGNEGVYYRFTTAGQWAYESGVEFAIDNNATPAEGPKSSAGAVYGMWAPRIYSYKAYSTGEDAWNRLRIVVKKDSVEHWLNDSLVAGYRYHSDAWWTAYDDSKWTGIKTYCMKVPGDRNGGYIEEGYIGLQGTHGGKWYIRNLRILSDTAKVKFGPVISDCNSTRIIPRSGRTPFIASTERLTGALLIRFSNMVSRNVTVSGLDGRQLPLQARIEGHGESVVLSGWSQAGLYLLQATGSDHTVRREKIFLP
jgi:hypothetical protein